MFSQKNKNKKSKINLWLVVAVGLGILLLVVLLQNGNLNRFGTVLKKPTKEKTENLEDSSQPKSKQNPNIDLEECSCGCNLPLEECNCPTAQSIKEGKEAPEPKETSPTVKVSVDDDPSLGPKDAPVTIIEFADFQCPYCARTEATIKQILNTYSNKVRFVYRDFPLGFHSQAQNAAEAAECADEQNKFWDYHSLLFERQSEWSKEGLTKFKEYADELSLNTTQFSQCLDSGQMASEVKQDLSDGQSYGVQGTPAFFVNGDLVTGAQPFKVFKQKIESILEDI